MKQIKEVILCPEFGTHGGGEEKIWVIETPVKPGDFVMPNDTILTVEGEKATLDVPSPKAGRITNVFVNIGDVLTRAVNCSRVVLT
jgi:pyruvate dehydrogenase E2 component (dihydrolipoamide acetyltransferase)